MKLNRAMRVAVLSLVMGVFAVDTGSDVFIGSATVRRCPFESLYGPGAIISEDNTSVQTLRSFADLHVRASGDEVELTCASGLWSEIVQSSKVALHIVSCLMTY